MAREILLGPKGLYDNTQFTPALVTPEMGRALAQWRFWSVGDSVPYFKALDTLVSTAEDRSSSISDVLANPNINVDGTLLADDEPMFKRENELNGFNAAVTDATGLGQYLLGHQHPDFPTSWAEIAQPRQGGRIGRMAIKAAMALNRRSQKSIEEIDKEGVDIPELFTGATSVAWQYIDAFDSDVACLALVRMSGLPKAAKKQLRIYKRFEKWERRFETTAGTPDPDRRLHARREIFHDIIDTARRITTQPNTYSKTREMAAVGAIVKSHDGFTEATGTLITELTEIIDIYEQQRNLT